MKKEIEIIVKGAIVEGKISIVVRRDGEEVLNIACDEGSENETWISQGPALSVAHGLMLMMRPKETT